MDAFLDSTFSLIDLCFYFFAHTKALLSSLDLITITL